MTENNFPKWLDDVATTLPPLVDYATIAKICGMSRGSVANLCSEGQGIDGGVIIGRRRMFPRLEVLKWIVKRAEKSTKVKVGV